MKPPRNSLLTLLAVVQDLRPDHPAERQLADAVEFLVKRRLLDLERDAGQRDAGDDENGAAPGITPMRSRSAS